MDGVKSTLYSLFHPYLLFRVVSNRKNPCLYTLPKMVSDERKVIYLDKTCASDFLSLDSSLRRNDEDRALASSPPERQKYQMSLSTEKSQSVAGQTRFEKLDMFSVSLSGPLKICGSYVGENTPEVFKKSRNF